MGSNPISSAVSPGARRAGTALLERARGTGGDTAHRLMFPLPYGAMVAVGRIEVAVATHAGRTPVA